MRAGSTCAIALLPSCSIARPSRCMCWERAASTRSARLIACRTEAAHRSLMHLVQILLPLFDNDGTPLPSGEYAKVRHELMERFGGLTAHTQAPAEGVWKD